MGADRSHLLSALAVRIAPALLIAGLLAGCGGSSDGGSPPAAPAAEGKATGPAAPAPHGQAAEAAASPTGAGLDIVTVRGGHPGSRAGLAVGDRIVAAGAQGATPDPVSWFLLETEEGTLGPVRIAVDRDGSRLEVELPPAPWGLTVAPALPAPVRPRLDELPDPAAAEALRQAVSDLRPVTRAWAELTIARAASQQETRQQALEAAAEALAELAADDPRVAGWLWSRRGLIERRNRETAAATASFTRAAELFEDRPLAAAGALIQRGIAHFVGDQRVAQQDFEAAARRIREVAPASTNLATALSLVGQCQTNRNELDEARRSHQTVLDVLAQVDPEHQERAQTLYQLGRVAHAMGDLATASRHYQEASDQFDASGLSTRDAGTALMGMGILAGLRGDLATADELYRRALAIFEREAPRSPHHIWSLRGIAGVAGSRGQLATAESVYTEALELASQIGDGESRTTAEVLWGLAETCEKRGRSDEALAHLERALAIFHRRLPESSTTVNLQTELGRLAIDGGRFERARTALENSRDRWQQIAPGTLWDGWTHFQLGRLAHAQGDPAAALEPFRRAHAIFHRWTPGTISEAEILHKTGRALRDLDRKDEALEAFLAAVDSLERQLPRLGAPESRAKARAEHRAIYDDAIDLLIETGRPGEAFHLLERSRARSLLAMLAERDLVFRSALPPELDLELRRARGAYATALRTMESLSAADSPEKVAAATEELRLAGEAQERLRQEVRERSPRLAELSDPQPLTWQQARKTLDPGTVALAYHVSAEHTSIFALSPGRDLEVATVPVTAETLAAEVDRFRLLLQAPPDREALHERGRELSQVLLLPVAKALADAERLLVVPDGPLHLLPFAALPAIAPPGDEPRYLVAALPIHLAGSVTLFQQLAAQRADRDGGSSAMLVAFGDPETGGGGDSAARRSDLAPLAAARDEVKSIARLFPRHSASTFVGSAATEARAKSVDPATRYLHFATHSLLDERMPLDSALVLHAGGADSGEDGLLRAWEIFEDIEVTAEMVTLSACESGLGSELAGEGLIGLTRAFHYAGARTVLASSWPVSDRSTAELMRLVYAGLHDGLTKDRALQRAQLQLLDGTLPATEPAGWWNRLTRPLTVARGTPAAGGPQAIDHPFYWAPFQLYGDWR